MVSQSVKKGVNSFSTVDYMVGENLLSINVFYKNFFRFYKRKETFITVIT